MKNSQKIQCISQIWTFSRKRIYDSILGF